MYILDDVILRDYSEHTPNPIIPPDVKQPSIVDALSKPKPASKTAAKKIPSFDSSDSGSSDAPTKAAPAKRKALDSDDSDRSADDLMSRIKGKKTTVASKVSPKLWRF